MHHLLQFALIALATCWLAMGCFHPASAQDALLSPGLGGVGQVGDLVYGAVMLDGRELFQVAAAKSSGSEQDRRGTGPLEIRINRIENRLQQLVQGGFLPDADQPDAGKIVVNTLNNLSVVQVFEAGASVPISVVTVTSNDAEVYGLPTPDLAEYYAHQIREGLERAWQERQPERVRRHIGMAGGIAIATTLLSGLFWLWLKQILRRQQTQRDRLRALQPQLEALEAAPDTASAANTEVSPQLEEIRAQQFDLRRRIASLGTRQRTLQVVQVVLWLVGISLMLRLASPQRHYPQNSR